MRTQAVLVTISLLGGCIQEYDLIQPGLEIPKAPDRHWLETPGVLPLVTVPPASSPTGCDEPQDEGDGPDEPSQDEDTGLVEVADDPPDVVDTGLVEVADDPPDVVDTGHVADVPPPEEPPADTSVPFDVGEEPLPDEPPLEEDPPSDPPPPPVDDSCSKALPSSWDHLSFPGGRESMFSHVGDIDGDGTDDAAWVNQLDNNVSIFWGGSIIDGAPPVTYNIGRSEGHISWGDVNGDGIFDLVSSNQDYGLVRVIPSAPGGGRGTAYTLPISGFPQPVLLDDTDSDGLLDIIVGLGRSGKTSVMRGVATGSWAAPVDFIPGTTRQLRLADLEGDGSKEYIQSYTGRLYSRGGGAPFATLPPPPGGAVWGMWPYDQDGDGRDEIVAHVWGGGTETWLEIWSWEPVGGLGFCGRSGTVPMAGIDRVTGLGDLDGDGTLDLTAQTTCPYCSSTYHVILGHE